MGRNNTTTLSLDTRQRIKKLYESGISPHQIARRLRVSLGSVYNYRKSPTGRAGNYERKKPVRVYYFISPDNVVHKVENVIKFSQDKELDPSRLHRLAREQAKTHKGWTFLKLETLQHDD